MIAQVKSFEFDEEKQLRQARAARIMELPLEFMPNPEFEKSNAAKRILTPMSKPEYEPRMPRRPKGLPAYLAALYEVPLLTRQQEQHLFRKYNFLKYRAARLRDRLNLARPSVGSMDKIEHSYDEAAITRNQIIEANLRLVVAIVKRYVGPQADLFELVSDGNQSLMRAVDKFDYAMGNKFSTYATWAIKKNCARNYAMRQKQAERFHTCQEAMLGEKPDERSDPREQEIADFQAKALVATVLSRLDARERQIIVGRFGLDKGTEPQTLKQVGDEMGVSKERTRQIEVCAFNKLRDAMKHVESSVV